MSNPINGVTVGTGMDPQAVIKKTDEANQIKKNTEDIQQLYEEIVDLKSVLSGGLKNVFNPSENTVDTAYNQAFILSSGAIRNDGSGSDEGYFVTGKLSIEPNTKYTIKPNIWIEALPAINRGRCYSSNDTALTALEWIQDDDGYYTFVSPENTEYVRFVVHKETIGINNGAYFEDIIALFNSIFSLNIEGGSGLAITNIVQTTGDSETDVMSQKAVTDEFLKIIKKTSSGINKYNPTTEGWVDNATIYSSGKVVVNESKKTYCVTPKIPVKPNVTYTIKPNIFGALASANRGRAYNSDDVALTQLQWTDNSDGSVTFTTPENSSYIRFTVSKEDIGSSDGDAFELTIKIFNRQFMLVEGTDAPSSFVPYDDEKLVINEEIVEASLKNYAKKENAMPLVGKVIVNFGDSIFGNARPPEDVSTFLANLTGATVHNCAFGGCRMGVHIGHWDAFSMYRLADAIATEDYSLQDEALNYDDRTSYAEVPLTLLKSIDFNNVDIVTIAYGTNDWTGNGSRVDNADNLYDTNYFGGALRYSIERLLGAYPNLKIFILCPTYRFWMDENLEFTEDSDTRKESGNMLSKYIELSREIAKNYHIPFIDNYYDLGINKFNRTRYFNANDGAHHKKEGRILLAEHIAKELF